VAHPFHDRIRNAADHRPLLQSITRGVWYSFIPSYGFMPRNAVSIPLISRPSRWRIISWISEFSESPPFLCNVNGDLIPGAFIDPPSPTPRSEDQHLECLFFCFNDVPFWPPWPRKTWWLRFVSCNFYCHSQLHPGPFSPFFPIGVL